MSWITRIFRAPDPPFEPVEERSTVSIGSPDIGRLFDVEPSLAGVPVTANSAMGLSAVHACVTLLSEVIGALPLRTIATTPEGTVQRSSSWLDEPAGVDGPTGNEFIATMMVSLLLWGNFFGLKRRNSIGQILWLDAIPPQGVAIDVKNGRKVYRVFMDDNKYHDFTDHDILHIPGPSLDGVRGFSPVTIGRNSLGMSLAGERTAARFFETGFRPSAIVSPTGDISADDANLARQTLERMVTGEAKGGSLAFLSKGFQVNPWTINPVDAQWLESRKFQLAEVARWFRIPPHMIGDVERSTSWGTGITEQTLGFQRFTLQPWTSRIEARLSRLLPSNLKAEFDYKQLLEGTQKEQIELLEKQCGGAYVTINEVRRVQNLPPIEGGDVLRSERAAPEAPKPEPEAPANE